MAETSNGGGRATNLSAGVSALSMATPEGGITVPVSTSQFYQEWKYVWCHTDHPRSRYDGWRLPPSKMARN